MFSKKYLKSGIGQSTSRDEKEAVNEALGGALKDLDGDNNFAIVYTDSTLDQGKIAKEVNAIIGKHWVGMSVDKHFSSKHTYDTKTTLSVLCIKSNYLHFSAETATKVRTNPRKKAKETLIKAIKHMNGTRDLDSYVAFTKTKRGNYDDLVHENQYLIISFVSSIENVNGKVVSGREVDFLEGLLDIVGITVPIFGAGAGSDFDTFLTEEKGNNYLFANGKVHQNAGVVVFCVSDLPFDVDVTHGYELTKDFAVVTKVDKTKHTILELNGKDPVAEYYRLLKISKTEYLKDPYKYSLTTPFGVVDLNGKTYVKEALPNEDGVTFHSTVKTNENTVVNIMKLNRNKLHNNFPKLLEETNKKRKPGLVLVSSCSTRRYLMGDKVAEVEKRSKKATKKLPYFGAFVFSELGSTRTTRPMVHGESITTLTFYDRLY